MAGMIMKHPGLFGKIEYSEGDTNKIYTEPNAMEKGPENTCVICYDPEAIPNTFYSPCSHAGVCKSCAQSILKSTTSCPICRQELEFLIFYEKTQEGKFVEVESLEVRNPLKKESNSSARLIHA